MNNKLFIILIVVFQFLLINKILSKEIQFNANEIEVLDGGNETVAKNGTVYIQKDKIATDITEAEKALKNPDLNDEGRYLISQKIDVLKTIN